MENKVSLAAVGIFVIVLAVAGIAGGLWLASGTYQRKIYDIYETYMTESVAGLNVNAAVRYRGVDVGLVRAVGLAPDNVEQVRVTLAIERGTPVKIDTVATLRTVGLTGIAFIELSGGRRESPALEAAPGQKLPVIRSAPSLIAGLETSVPALTASLSRAVDNFNGVLDADNRRALRATLSDLATLSHTLAGRAASIDATLANAARTADQTARFSAQLPQMLARFDRTAQALERMADDVSEASAGARRTLADASGAFDSARRTIDASRADVAQFTGGALPETRELVSELRGLTATMRRAVDELERNPAVLLQGPPPARRGPGE